MSLCWGRVPPCPDLLPALPWQQPLPATARRTQLDGSHCTAQPSQAVQVCAIHTVLKVFWYMSHCGSGGSRAEQRSSIQQHQVSIELSTPALMSRQLKKRQARIQRFSMAYVCKRCCVKTFLSMPVQWAQHCWEYLDKTAWCGRCPKQHAELCMLCIILTFDTMINRSERLEMQPETYLKLKCMQWLMLNKDNDAKKPRSP